MDGTCAFSFDTLSSPVPPLRGRFLRVSVLSFLSLSLFSQSVSLSVLSRTARERAALHIYPLHILFRDTHSPVSIQREEKKRQIV